MSVCIATLGMYWQSAIPGGGPGGYTDGSDRPGIVHPQKPKRLDVSVKLVNVSEDQKLEVYVSPIEVIL